MRGDCLTLLDTGRYWSILVKHLPAQNCMAWVGRCTAGGHSPCTYNKPKSLLLLRQRSLPCHAVFTRRDSQASEFAWRAAQWYPPHLPVEEVAAAALRHCRRIY